jgi:exo-beta-1,3-glucanase (GH17 family)
MTYGVLHGLDYTFEAAKQRNIKVIAIIWLDADPAINNDSIAAGVRAANAYPDTIVRVSCGSEVRTRHGTTLDDQISSCIAAMRAAGVVQPVTTIDIWWEWCNRAYPCQRNAFGDKVDWIGINVFPWWENKDSGLFPCTPAAQASIFHINRIRDVRATYPGKDVVITEFGWPAAPAGYSEVNRFTGQKCGIAGEPAQTNVIAWTITMLDAQKWSGVVFEAFREPWKAIEGPVGPYWGICESIYPHICKPVY